MSNVSADANFEVDKIIEFIRNKNEELNLKNWKYY